MRILLGITIALCSSLIIGSSASAIILDRLDFFPELDEIYRYNGTFSGTQGTVEQRTIIDIAGVPGGTISYDTLIASDPADDNITTTYSVDTKPYKVDNASSSGQLTIVFTPPPAEPRFFEIGKSYTTNTLGYVLIEGQVADMSVSLTQKAIGIENVTTPLGTFETLKVEVLVSELMVLGNAWFNSSSSGFYWAARGLGRIKEVSSMETTSNVQATRTVQTNTQLYYTSAQVVNLPVIQAPAWDSYPQLGDNWVETDNWLGPVEVSNDPWVWRYDTGEYIFVPQSSARLGTGWTFTP